MAVLIDPFRYPQIGLYRLGYAFECTVPPLVWILGSEDEVAPTVIDIEIMEGADPNQYRFQEVIGPIVIRTKGPRHIDIDHGKVDPRRAAENDLLAVDGRRDQHVTYGLAGDLDERITVCIRGHRLRVDDGSGARVDGEVDLLIGHHVAIEIDDVGLDDVLLGAIGECLADDHREGGLDVRHVGLGDEIDFHVAFGYQHRVPGSRIDYRCIRPHRTGRRA